MTRTTGAFLVLLLHSCLYSTALGKDLLFCHDDPVELKADDFKIPWVKKEHYIEVQETPQAITCTLKDPEWRSEEVALNVSHVHMEDSNYKVEWLFYPDYVTLKDLEEDYSAVHEQGLESTLLESPCHLPSPASISSVGLGHRRGGAVSKRASVCPEHATRFVSVTAETDPAEGAHRSKLTFNRASLGHTGTYLCTWSWGVESKCVARDEEDDDVFKLMDGLAHRRQRSAVLYVKVYESKSYLHDLATVCAAAGSLAVVLVALWCMDEHIRSFTMADVKPEYL